MENEVVDVTEVRKVEKDEEENEGEGEEHKEEERKYENVGEIDKAALVIQKLILRSLAKQQCERMKKRRLIRMNGVKELWESEKDYSNAMQVVREVYMKPLMKLSRTRKRPIITPRDYRQIFQGLEAIIGFSKSLMEYMKGMIFDPDGSYNHHNMISCSLLSMNPFLKFYHEYESRYDKTIEMLGELKQNNKKFARLLELMDNDERTNRLGLQNYLIKPISRYPRYPLLIREIIKYTDEEHPDYVGLRKARKVFIEYSRENVERKAEISRMKEEEEKKKREVPTPDPPLPPLPPPEPYELLTARECVMIVKNWKEPAVIYHMQEKKEVDDRSMSIRKFLVSPTEDRMMWGEEPDGKNKSVGEIKISEIREVAPGQGKTITFRMNPKPGICGLSFSLLYGEGNFDERNIWTGKSLDLISPNRRQCVIWKRALSFLVEDQGKTADERKIDSPDSLDFGEILSLEGTILEREWMWEAQGDLYTFGTGLGGGLGHGNEVVDLKIPKLVRRSLFVDVKKIVGGNNACIAILSDGHCMSWGLNECGRLGLGDSPKSTSQPQMISALSDHTIIDACIGDEFGLFLDTNGAVLGCGMSESGVLGVPRLRKENQIDIPEIIFRSPPSEKYIRVSCSRSSAAVVDAKGRAFTWGSGEFGQLGHGDKNNYSEPKIVESLMEEVVEMISFGDRHSLFLTKRGDVFCAGEGGISESEIPLHIKELKNIKQVSSGGSHCGAISKDDFRLFMWGCCGSSGQVGNGSCEKVVNFSPTEIKGLAGTFYNFVQLSCADNHCICLVEDKMSGLDKKKNKLKKRQVLVWGAGRENGIIVDRPTSVPFFDTKKSIRRVCGAGRMCAVIVGRQWIPDEEVSECMNCHKEFTKFRRRRHHCRSCLGLYCGRCTKGRVDVNRMGFGKFQQRVCEECFKLIKGRNNWK